MTDEIIDASREVLMAQAQDTAEAYFKESVAILKGSKLEFTAADAVALAAVMAKDFHTTSIGVAAQKIVAAIQAEWE
jgi:hypothetical protein